jgi:hypothetical protein
MKNQKLEKLSTKIIKFSKEFNIKIKKDKIHKYHEVRAIQMIYENSKVIQKFINGHNLYFKNNLMNN